MGFCSIFVIVCLSDWLDVVIIFFNEPFLFATNDLEDARSNVVVQIRKAT